MAETPKDEEITPTIEIPTADVEKAAELILAPGFVTKKDLPKMKDLAWATALSKAVTKHFLENDDDHDPYVYFEQFDFAGGDIDSILFNMDVVPTREAALQDLADALGEKIVVPKDNDQETY